MPSAYAAELLRSGYDRAPGSRTIRSCGWLRRMPHRNRVTPLGELVADPTRGLVYGNRGCLHHAGGTIVRPFQVRRWIACRLDFKGRRRSPLMQPGRYTELFFLDEATALAAGHRPCAECRREDYVRFLERWTERHPRERTADAIDLRLHAERFDAGTRSRRFHDVELDTLPEGAFVLRDGEPYVVAGSSLICWTPRGYTSRVPRRGRQPARSITPPSLVEHLRDGSASAFRLLHPSAND